MDGPLAIDSHATEDKLTILDMFKHGQAQYIYYDSKLLVPVVFLTKLA